MCTSIDQRRAYPQSALKAVGRRAHLPQLGLALLAELVQLQHAQLLLSAALLQLVYAALQLLLSLAHDLHGRVAHKHAVREKPRTSACSSSWTTRRRSAARSALV